ncbi:MFS transporter [Paenarthrobacter nicotinovorans]|uniref:MFS transporter n=1 Tax=Paenarthrobacter nicotinovorans TaxID=29320 RepID=UPI003807D4BD
MSCTVQAFEFAAFAFYLPMILAGLGIASRLENNLVTIAVNCVAAASAWIGPLLLRKIGHRGLSQRGFALVVVGLVVAAVGVMTSNTWMVGIGSAVMLWGHYWDAESGMTVVSLVAKPAYRGAASGVGYMLVKATAFVTTLVFPTLFQQLGVPTAALLIAIGPAIAFFVTTFVLPEVFGHGAESREAEELDGVAH